MTRFGRIFEEPDRRRRLVALFAAPVSAAFFYVFLEWLFFVTKPSFMSSLSWAESFRLLAEMSAIAAWPLLCATFFLGAGLGIVSSRSGRWSAAFLPAAAVAATLFLAVDNFTYTLLGFGIRTVTGTPQRYAYAGLAGLLLVLSCRFVLRNSVKIGPRAAKWLFAAAATVLAVGSPLWLLTPEQSMLPAVSATGAGQAFERRPNILLFGGDGLDSRRMSVYGYTRDTTPFLSRFARNALVCENAFSNAAHTGAALASILTGKLPTESRLIYPPDILRGTDVFQHLPGILRRHGYRNLAVSIRHYADPYDLNLRESFDWANSRGIPRDRYSHLQACAGLRNVYFLEKLIARATDRLWHLLAWNEMDDAYQEAARHHTGYQRDQQRIDTLLQHLDQGDPQLPFFAHIHLMGTHGALFYPRERAFSDGQEQTDHWMPDFYDDAVKDFDRFFQQTIESLEDRGQLSNTLVIVYSDHGPRSATYKPIPLIFGFPGQTGGRTIEANVQNIDIAPTILDHLGISKPSWMKGESLLSQDLDPLRPVFIAGRALGRDFRGEGGWQMDLNKIGPPFYSLGSVDVLVCHRWFRLFMAGESYRKKAIANHTAPCPNSRVPSWPEARQMILDHLEQHGYDISSL